MLLYDPNCNEDIESIITIIRRDEWNELVSLYVRPTSIPTEFAAN
jgi:hypothetical protein